MRVGPHTLEGPASATRRLACAWEQLSMGCASRLLSNVPPQSTSRCSTSSAFVLYAATDMSQVVFAAKVHAPVHTEYSSKGAIPKVQLMKCMGWNAALPCMTIRSGLELDSAHVDSLRRPHTCLALKCRRKAATRPST